MLVPVAVLALAAAGYLVFRPVTDPGTIACYREADLRPSAIAVLSGADDPLAACAAMWEPGGELGEPTASEVPPLVACVLDSGMVAVFPGGPEVCAALGLASPDPDPGVAEENRLIVELEEALISQIAGRCLPEDQAAAIVRRELDQKGFEDWQVAVTVPFTAERPCASLGFDPANRTVHLVPVDR
ncbi:MAG: hypothetical protein ACRDVM_01540 [Acidimicrobiia bacterium]